MKEKKEYSLQQNYINSTLALEHTIYLYSHCIDINNKRTNFKYFYVQNIKQRSY